MITRSIIGLTLNFRDAARTSRCIASLLDDGAEAVLVWDNSEDAGRSASELRQQWAGNDRIRIEQSPRNLGFAAGVNRGLEAVRQGWPHSWALLINNDAVLGPGSLQALSQALAAHPQAVLAFPTIDHRGRAFGAAYYHRVLALITSYPLPGSFPYASGCCQLIAPERYSGKLYDEDFFMYGEDVELSWRLGVNRIVFVSAAKVMHEGSATSKLGTAFYETLLVESHLRLIDKLAQTRFDRRLLLLGRLVSLPARALMRTWRYRSLVPLRALAEGWKRTVSASLL